MADQIADEAGVLVRVVSLAGQRKWCGEGRCSRSTPLSGRASPGTRWRTHWSPCPACRWGGTAFSSLADHVGPVPSRASRALGFGLGLGLGLQWRVTALRRIVEELLIDQPEAGQTCHRERKARPPWRARRPPRGANGEPDSAKTVPRRPKKPAAAAFMGSWSPREKPPEVAWPGRLRRQGDGSGGQGSALRAPRLPPRNRRVFQPGSQNGRPGAPSAAAQPHATGRLAAFGTWRKPAVRPQRATARPRSPSRSVARSRWSAAGRAARSASQG